jgi:N,N'-diacetyllegionaminate synthase
MNKTADAYANKNISFGNRQIGKGQPVVIMAEIGVNHEGSVETCARMIEAAASAGADAVKLQTIDADENYVKGTPSYELFSRCSLTADETAAMFDLARKLDMEVFTTVGDLKTLEWLDRLEPAAHKISSGLLTNHRFIRQAAQTGRTLLMSTGMAEEQDIDSAVAAARDTGCSSLGIFQCTSIYPASAETLNLAVVPALAARYGIPIGFSDHSPGTEAAPLAVAIGAQMIEKHFTLDRNRESFDHVLSLEPKEFSVMVRAIRNAEVMIGSPEKTLTPTERENRKMGHRCLVASRTIKAGDIFSEKNLGLKRPFPDRRGLDANLYEIVLGTNAVSDLTIDDPVTKNDVEQLK